MVKDIEFYESLHKRTGNPKALRKLEAARKALDVYEIPKIQKKKKIVFTRQKFTTKSSYALKLLSWRVKKRQGSSMIDALKDKKGKVHFNPGDQVQAMLEFLKDLYQSTNLNVEEIRNFLATPEIVKKLTPEHREFMDSPISAQEILDEIKRIHPNKARGPDGFPIEFFKKFATELSPALERTFNFVRSTGQIPDSWKQVNIVTIPKPNKDVSLPSSYRPIAVLNKDYKIFTGVLVCRLNKIVQFYVEEDQTGFIAHRNISDNIRWVLNVIHFCKSRKVDSVALALDFKKAFDSVEFMYIHKLLEVMDFGPEFLSIINSIYGQSTTRLKVNFRFSDDFHINRGT